MKLVLFFFFTLLSLFNNPLFASFPEFYGTGPSTSSIGNQANGNSNDPANNYYIPALAAWSTKITLAATSSVVSHSFEDINGVVTENQITGQSGTSTVSGQVNTNYEDSYNTNIHLLFPLKYKEAGAIGISYFAPIGGLVETNSGHPFLPEYSLYRARYRRTQIHANYALPLGESWAISLGTHIGFQASARVNTQVSLDNGYGSSGSAKTDIKPSLGIIASLAYKSNLGLSYFTFQQEMKSNLEAVATGDISNPPLTLINVGLENMIYYDPHILRFGHVFESDLAEFSMSLEYQMWDNYEAPLIKVRNLGGTVKASGDYERLNLRNTFTPKIGVALNIIESVKVMAGLAYRQSPLDGDFSGSGNTIDSNVYMLSSGLTYDFKLFTKDIQLGASLQYHKLEEKTVTKTTGQENGASGVKIGSPGFKVGGNILMAMGGAKISF